MSYPTSGTYQRQYPRLEVLRGFNPNEPFTLSQAYPVKSGVTILSGQVISPEWQSATEDYQWVLGVASQGVAPFIALNDSADYDVVSAGNLNGLSCAGQFEVQIPFYKTADAANLVNGVAIAADGTTGNIKVAGTSDVVIGNITRNHGPLDITGTNSSASTKLVVSFTTGFSGVVHA